MNPIKRFSFLIFAHSLFLLGAGSLITFFIVRGVSPLNSSSSVRNQLATANWITEDVTTLNYTYVWESEDYPSNSSINNVNAETRYSTKAAYDPLVSMDGRFVVFLSYSQNLLDPNDPSNPKPPFQHLPQLYIRNTQTRQIRMVSVDANGNAAQGSVQSSSYSTDTLSISANGQYVVFQCDDPNLVPIYSSSLSSSPRPGTSLYIRDTVNGFTSRAVLAYNNVDLPDAECLNPSISSDGRFLAFESAATNLVPHPEEWFDGKTSYLYVRDLVQGVTRILLGPNEYDSQHFTAMYPLISGNGRYVLHMRDYRANRQSGLYLFDLETNDTITVATDAEGDIIPTIDFDISYDGSLVLFSGSDFGSRLGSEVGNRNTPRLYLADISSGSITQIAPQDSSDNRIASTGCSRGKSLSQDGHFVLYKQSYRNKSVVLNIFDTETRAVIGTVAMIPKWKATRPYNHQFAISGDGSIAAFSDTEVPYSGIVFDSPQIITITEPACPSPCPLGEYCDATHHCVPTFCLPSMQNCSGNGECITSPSACTCNQGWSGDICQDFVGESSSSESSNSNGIVNSNSGSYDYSNAIRDSSSNEIDDNSSSNDVNSNSASDSYSNGHFRSASSFSFSDETSSASAYSNSVDSDSTYDRAHSADLSSSNYGDSSTSSEWNSGSSFIQESSSHYNSYSPNEGSSSYGNSYSYSNSYSGDNSYDSTSNAGSDIASSSHDDYSSGSSSSASDDNGSNSNVQDMSSSSLSPSLSGLFTSSSSDSDSNHDDRTASAAQPGQEQSDPSPSLSPPPPGPYPSSSPYDSHDPSSSSHDSSSSSMGQSSGHGFTPRANSNGPKVLVGVIVSGVIAFVIIIALVVGGLLLLKILNKIKVKSPFAPKKAPQAPEPEPAAASSEDENWYVLWDNSSADPAEHSALQTSQRPLPPYS